MQHLQINQYCSQIIYPESFNIVFLYEAHIHIESLCEYIHLRIRIAEKTI